MEKKGFINVDELMPQVSLEQAANFYGVPLPELKKVGSETRTAYFLNCDKKGPTGDRVLAIQADRDKYKFALRGVVVPLIFQRDGKETMGFGRFSVSSEET